MRSTPIGGEPLTAMGGRPLGTGERELLQRTNERLVLATLHAQRLAEEAESFRLLVAGIKDHAIFLCDPEGKVISWNQAAERMFGYKEEEAVGKPLASFCPPEPPFTGRCGQELALARESGHWRGEGLRLRKDGSRFMAQVELTALSDPEGHLISFGAVIRDLSDDLRREAERLALARAEAAERSKDDFLAMMGHELRNPLAPMVAAVELLKRNEPGAAREIAILERQLAHMHRLVDDLLDVSRALRGQVTLNRAPVEMAELVQQAVEMVREAAEVKGHQLELEVPLQGLLVEVDRVRLVQTLANLLQNAVKYTDPGGRIAILAQRVGLEVKVRVADNGSGIDPTFLPRIFELFTQGRQSLERKAGGLGVGLGIARQLVRAHGGTLTAESAGLGRGSCFTLRLQAVEGPAARPAPVAQAASASRRVLVVDDNADFAEMLGALLEAEGHETRAAGHAAAGLALAASFEPDLIIADLGLPGMDGYELARRLRALPGLPKFSLVALSGYARDSDRERALAAGFDAHLAKPIEVEDLDKLLAEW